MTAGSEAPQVEVRSRADLRDWLKENHDTSGTVWLVTWKKGTDHYVPFGDVVEELLCWGWIDSVGRRVDDLRTSTRISPRNPKSAWSGINKRLVAKARTSGAMTPTGEAAISRAEENGMWTFLDDVEAMVVPDDLARALGDDRETWEGWTPSVRRAWLEKVKLAKTAPTRGKRIAMCVAAARAGTPRAGLG